VPQHRERIFIVGHLRGRSTRKVFPIIREDGETNKTIKEVAKIYPNRHSSDGNSVLDTSGISHTVTAHSSKDAPKIRINQVGNISNSKSFNGNPQTGRVYGTDGISPTLNTMQGGGLEPKILDVNGHKNYKYKPLNIVPTLRAQAHGNEPKVAIPVSDVARINKSQNGRRVKNNGDPEFTLTTQDRHGAMVGNMRIRKLTPLECWRLQGFPDLAFERAKQAGLSDSQLYKQSGNSVTVPVIKAIAENMEILNN